MLKKPKPEDLKLNNEINAVLDSMSVYGPDTPEYPKFIAHLRELNELRQNKKSARRVSPDTVALVLGNLGGILIVVAYEHVHVITSKGFNLLLKAK